ncbi:MAG: efflux RND transporter periplasmic adaptor subunit [Isosphaeraceae bacterium]
MKQRGVILFTVLIAPVAVFSLAGSNWLRQHGFAKGAGPESNEGQSPGAKADSARPQDSPRVSLAEDVPNAVRVPEEVVRSFGIRTAPAREPNQLRTFNLAGSLALDTNRLAHLHTRFVGEVVELGMISDSSEGTEGGRPKMRPIRFGDHVEKGQILAVLWSSELGEKKSEYVDALSRLRLEQETLTRLEALYKDEAIAERNLREARHNVEADEIAVARVERTLHAWRLTDEEIAAIRSEAELIRKRTAPQGSPVEKSWARVELHASLAGTVLEKNCAVGDIVDTATDLFKIADLSQLWVWAHVYEEDLPTLLALPEPVRWTIRLKSDPAASPMAGWVEKIGDIIDPNQHTALVIGQVDNPRGRMRAGQFVTATVELPPTPGEVEVPVTAVVDDGEETVVFVQPDPRQPIFVMRRGTLLRRIGPHAYVRGRAASPGAPTVLSIRSGDLVVSSGAIELKSALKQLWAAVKSSAAPAPTTSSSGSTRP